MALTQEELDEIASLEADEEKTRAALADEAQRQHLAALRMKKRLATTLGVVGRDFIVIETTLGNIAIRRPTDLEVDMLEEKPEDREAMEKYASGIVVEPSATELQKWMATNPGLVGPISIRSLTMLRVVREEEEKK